MKKIIIIFCFIILPVHLALFAEKASARYRVSGIVELSYNNDELRSRGVKTSSRASFSQLYGLNFSSPLVDPRFMLLRASVQDTITLPTNDSFPDQNILTYDLGLTLFPGLRVSADLFGRKSVSTISETASAREYDVETASYGGSLLMRFGGGAGRNGNYRNNRNNNNNANNNDGGSWLGLLRSSINLSYTHTDAESLSAVAPREETRDNASASANLQVNSALAVELSGGREEYENLLLNNGYETTHVGAVARYSVSPDAELRIDGRMAKREADNISTVLSDEEVMGYGVYLDIKGKDRLRQNYSHTVTSRKQTDTVYDDQNTTARLTWQLREKFYAVTGLQFRMADFEQDPTVLVPLGINSSYDTGAVLGGAGYTATFTPSFLGSFALQTDYEFNAGYSKYATNEAVPQGSGTYYVNRGGVQLNSTAWKNDSLSMGYHVVSQRDDSPLNYDFYDTTASLVLRTTRLPRTSVSGNVTYLSHRLSNDGGSVFTSRPVVSLSEPLVNQLGKTERRRGFTYIVDGDHRLSDYVSLLAGVNRGQQVAETATLSSLLTTDETNFLAHGSVRLNYPITRNLTWRADAREEYRSRLVSRIRSHIFDTFLTLRYRQISLSLEYRLREDAPTNEARTVKQLIYAKISRPF